MRVLEGKMKVLICSPHCDDELIGCFSALYNLCQKEGNEILISYCDSKNESRILESKNLVPILEEHVPISIFSTIEQTYFYSDDLLEVKLGRVLMEWEPSMVLAPDPYSENHPLHKFVGSFCRHFVSKYLDNSSLVFYSTSMQSPFLSELPSDISSKKERILNLVYPSQKDLWRYEKKYILFESYMEEVRWDQRRKFLDD
jgi:LmbE family N-acetylglucosaminyl deacetylase